jgi:hypothetical protein
MSDLAATSIREESAMTTFEDWRELALREADGLVVALLWSDRLQRVEVVVTDTWLHRQIEFAVAAEHALDAFRHPFLYAGVEFDAAHAPAAREVAA